MPISLKDTANITTANWGTARNIQIGNSSKSVNGSANVSWSLSEIGAAAASHGRHIPDVCETITDWNNATKNGWYMGNNATNSPTANAWYFGEVIAHNTNYVFQTVYQFNVSSDAKGIPKYIRVKMNGTWGAWTNVTVAKAVPSNAVFTDTNTWRGVQDNLTSTATDQSLSANQGKVLKGLIDGKAASNHTHSYVPLANGGNITIHADSDSSSTGEYALIKAGHNELKIASSAGGTTVTKGQDKLTFNGNIVYHAGRKPTISEIGAAASNHTHGLVNLNSEAFGGGNDLNTYNSTKTWVARTLNSTTNKPGDYFTVVNFGANSNSNFQLAHSYANNSTLYVRGRHDTSGNYTPWAKIYTDKNKPTASEIGAAAASHTHNYAGSSSAGGNANAAVKLATARTINGTNFDGSANITTANWGTARTITVGNTGKSVNGSGNVSWSLSEIGAASTATATTTTNGLMSKTDKSNLDEWKTFKNTGGEIGGGIFASTLKSWGDTMVDGELWLNGFSREPHGYTKLPNGMIIQWGLVSETVSGLSDKITWVRFPIEFPNRVVNITHSFSCQDSNTNPRIGACYSYPDSNSVFKARWVGLNLPYAETVTSIRFSWLAIGY